MHARSVSSIAVIVIVGLGALSGRASAQPPAPPSPVPAAALEALRARAQERMRADHSAFSREEIRDIEELYQSANRDLRAPDAKQKLIALVDQHPASNRTGCAVLYLAQLSQGEEAEKYLKLAIEKHENAWYGDGAQVGALARFQLARFYWQGGKQDGARAVAQELRTKFPDAVDHNGRRLVDLLANSPLKLPD
jgi:hypothetical protein